VEEKHAMDLIACAFESVTHFLSGTGAQISFENFWKTIHGMVHCQTKGLWEVRLPHYQALTESDQFGLTAHHNAMFVCSFANPRRPFQSHAAFHHNAVMAFSHSALACLFGQVPAARKLSLCVQLVRAQLHLSAYSHAFYIS
jgi:hypothetical protein